MRANVILATLAVLLLTTAGVVGTLYFGWGYGLPSTDRISLTNTVVGLAAYVIVTTALVVALLAYVAATGQPDLEPFLFFTDGFPSRDPHELVARVVRHDSEGNAAPWIAFDPSHSWRIAVVLRNRSSYAARNPGVHIDLSDMQNVTDQPGWSRLEGEAKGNFQWDGGVDYIVHGPWTRTLPSLTLDGAGRPATARLSMAIPVTVAADGFRPKIFFFFVRLCYAEYGDYEKHVEEVLQRFEEPFQDSDDGLSILWRLLGKLRSSLH